MDNIKNVESNKWVRPWNIEKFDDLYNRDDRFFAIVVKGLLSWLNENIVLYNKPIKHFIYNTGSAYLYVESNGYEYSLNETSGEDYIYMQMPRGIVEVGDIHIPTEELTQPFVRAIYERRDGNDITGFNAEVRRLPVELTLNVKYVLSNFNESIILAQELMDKIMFQRFFNVIYLGEVVHCSVEFPQDIHIEMNKIDMTATETNQKTIEISLTLCTNYPQINERTEISSSKIIEGFSTSLDTYDNIEDDKTLSDTIEKNIY